MDNRGGSIDSVGAGAGEQLHHGGMIHLLLVIALIVVVVGFFQGRRGV
jgi:preprotein translocase subunit SecF